MFHLRSFVTGGAALAALVTGLFVSNSARADIVFGVVGDYNSTNPSVTTNNGPTYSSSTVPSFGEGVLLYLGLPKTKFELETGALRMERKVGWVESQGGITFANTWTFTDVQIPALLRYTPFRYLSLGAGFVYNISQGSVLLDQTDYSGGLAGGSFSGQSQTYDEAGWAKNDTAYEFSAELRIPFGRRWAALIDANTQLGITNFDTSAATVTKINLFQLLAGLTVSL